MTLLFLWGIGFFASSSNLLGDEAGARLGEELLFSVDGGAITLGNYAAFLNQVAASDNYQLYDEQMSDGFDGGAIVRSREPGSYRYEVIGNENLPVNYVGLLDLMRYCNYLENIWETSERNQTTPSGATQQNELEIPNNEVQLTEMNSEVKADPKREANDEPVSEPTEHGSYDLTNPEQISLDNTPQAHYFLVSLSSGEGGRQIKCVSYKTKRMGKHHIKSYFRA